MDKAKFYAALHATLFPHYPLTQAAGVELILDAWSREAPTADPRFIAYSLATAYHETARKMTPIREYGLGRGHPYGQLTGPYMRAYYGRGLVQLTWMSNYKLATIRLRERGVLKPDEDLVRDPDLALRPDISAAILVCGMSAGWFTGRCLQNYFSGDRSDWVDARQIINGHDRARLIAGYGLHFLHALEVAKDAPIEQAAA